MIDYLCGRDADGHPGAGMVIRHGIAGYVPPGWRPDDGRPASALRRRKCGCGGTADTGDLKSPIGDDVRVRVPLTALVCACGEIGSRAGVAHILGYQRPGVLRDVWVRGPPSATFPWGCTWFRRDPSEIRKRAAAPDRYKTGKNKN